MMRIAINRGGKLIVVFLLVFLIAIIYATTEKKQVITTDHFGNPTEIIREYYDDKGNFLHFTHELIERTYISEEGDYDTKTSTLYDDKGRIIKTSNEFFYRDGSYETEETQYSYNNSWLERMSISTSKLVTTPTGDVTTDQYIVEKYDTTGKIKEKTKITRTSKEITTPRGAVKTVQRIVEEYGAGGIIKKKTKSTWIEGKYEETETVATTYYNKAGGITHRVTYEPHGFKKKKTVERFDESGKIKNMTISIINQFRKDIEIPHARVFIEFDEQGKEKKSTHTYYTYGKGISLCRKKVIIEDEKEETKKETEINYDEDGYPVNITITDYVQGKKTLEKWDEKKQEWKKWEWNEEKREWEEVSYVPEEYPEYAEPVTYEEYPEYEGIVYVPDHAEYVEYEEYSEYEEYFAYEEYQEYAEPVEYSEGSWNGTFECATEITSFIGEWDLDITEGIVNGSVRVTSPPIGSGVVYGIITGDNIIAYFDYVILGQEGTATWEGVVGEKDVAGGTTEFEAYGQTVECTWSGAKKAKEEVRIHYGSLQRRKTNGRINITYVPICTEKCTEIVFIQVICPKIIFKDGSSSYYEHQNDSSSKWNYLNKDEVNGGKSCVLDYHKGEKDPYYNGHDAKDSGIRGKHGSSRNATMLDRPRIGENEFTNLEKKYKKPVTKVVYEYEVCAFCTRGADAPKYYGCFRWSYEQEKGKGWKNGKASYEGTTQYKPSKKFAKAVVKWIENH